MTHKKSTAIAMLKSGASFAEVAKALDIPVDEVMAIWAAATPDRQVKSQTA